jgi:hypothetical protein
MARNYLIRHYDPHITHFMSRVKQRCFERPVNYFTREELCKPKNIGICKTLSVVEGDEPCQQEMQGDQSAQLSTDTENKHPTQIIHGVDEYPDINDTLSSIEIGDEEDNAAYAEQQEALRLELEILNEQYKEKGGLKKMKNPLENLVPENDKKDSLIVNVSEDWNILPTFKSSLAEVFDNVGMLHIILFFTLHFNALLFTLLVTDINRFTICLSVLLVNIISVLYLSI